ncbi:MAG: hypothetical protein WD771_08225 [Gemmatimonadaceae bacterium]
MTLWLLSLAAGLALAALSYRWPAPGVPRLGFALRALAGALVAAVTLDAPPGASRPVAPWVALDASASWLAVGGEGRWARARAVADSLRRAGADSTVLFGDSLRGASGAGVGAGAPALPADTRSDVGPAVEAARALGRPLLVVTDGRLDNAERLRDLPVGSAVIVVTGDEPPDVGIAALEAPAAVVAGDSLEVRLTLRSGAAGGPAGSARVAFGGRALGAWRYDALPAYGELELRFSLVAPSAEGVQPYEVILEPGDAVAANDTARASMEITGVASAVVISTSPDPDARLALDVLRGTRRGAVRGYWRVAPGQWRLDGALRAVDEAVVRRALGEAAVVVLHGDTGYFGPPHARARGALVLLVPAAGSEDFYAVAAGDGPLLAALADLPWDSLPPLRVGLPSAAASEAAAEAAAGQPALLSRRARRLEERAVVLLHDGARRAVTVPASGLWRWRTRGGRSAQAFDAVWGSIFDWVGAERRGGETGTGGARLAGEWVPRPPTVAAGPVGEGAALDLVPRARTAWWLVALAIAMLCVEWVLRRRIGWR